MAVLHVTNGTEAARDLKTLGQEVLTWDDVLHEGPVLPQPPAALRETRARFLADAGLASSFTETRARLAARDARLDAVDFSTKLVLWFEDDLYDQLQLVQILDRLATGEGALRRSRPLGPVQLVHLPRGPRTFLRDRLARAGSLGADDHATAARAWAAVTAPDPRAVQDASQRLTERPPANLPHLAAALHRLLEEHPATTDGLSRTERQILEALQGGPLHPRALFTAVGAREERPFFGDSTLWWRAGRLAPRLLTIGADGTYALAGDGRAVLAGEADAAALLAPLDRWVGGVHHRTTPAARYDPATRHLAA
ncbi:MAG TPA: hypothetical protein VFG42_20665 [Baekduia sp.]|uniref:hypothetical protein n=1 Tax=Baekduia sp. TaxID=2600305 RepID=UPI002D7A2529|nr:hypothetical protein [Baekduia sp.]HET6509221.1 hypothetical protein [Baekduia sp.]